MNEDGKPEIIVQVGALADEVGRPIGSESLLIYGNVSGTCGLILNVTAESTHISRAFMIDYYQNGTEYMITCFNSSLVLVHYNSGYPEIRKWLGGGGYAIAVGDASNNGMPDILTGGDTLTVRENQGEGQYEHIKGYGYPWDEIRIEDVTGDRLNDVVIVGNGPLFGVWTRVEGHYKRLWTYSSTIS